MAQQIRNFKDSKDPGERDKLALLRWERSATGRKAEKERKQKRTQQLVEPKTEPTDLEKHCHKLGVHYQWLAVHAMNSGQKRWQQVPKLHYLVAHIPGQAKLINPIFVQGYCNESMVGTLSKIFASSYNGPHHDVSGVTVMKKYLTVMYIDWWQAHE